MPIDLVGVISTTTDGGWGHFAIALGPAQAIVLTERWGGAVDAVAVLE